jgi:hypothetical protein
VMWCFPRERLECMPSLKGWSLGNQAHFLHGKTKAAITEADQSSRCRPMNLTHIPRVLSTAPLP